MLVVQRILRMVLPVISMLKSHREVMMIGSRRLIYSRLRVRLQKIKVRRWLNQLYTYRWCYYHFCFFLGFFLLFQWVLVGCNFDVKDAPRSAGLPATGNGRHEVQGSTPVSVGYDLYLPLLLPLFSLGLLSINATWPQPDASHNWLTLAAELGEDSRRPNLSLAGITVSSLRRQPLTMTLAAKWQDNGYWQT